MPYDEFIQHVPLLESGHGRIYFFVNDISQVKPFISINTMDPDCQGVIELNNEKIGMLDEPYRFFFVDRPAGRYEVSLSRDSCGRASFLIQLEPGETLFVEQVSTERLMLKDRTISDLANLRYFRDELPLAQPDE